MSRRPAAALLAGAGLLAAAGILRRALLPPTVRIADPGGPPTIDALGRAHSLQAADLAVAPAAAAALFSPTGLDRLGQTYWRFLRRGSLGLLRVVTTADARLLVLLARPVVLLAFSPPDILVTADRGAISWSIRGGLLAARRRTPPGPGPAAAAAGVGQMRIEVRRREPTAVDPASLHIEFAVVDFEPALARRLGPAFYAATQARLHVVVTHAFMRSLARMRLAPPGA